MIKLEEISFEDTDIVMVNMSVPKDEWEKIQSSEEWQRILNGDVSARIVEKPATEETLQSIDSTLKRIEKLLEKNGKDDFTPSDSSGTKYSHLSNSTGPGQANH